MLDMTALAGSMARVLEELGYGDDGFGKVDVCGYHTGAMVALELAVSRRDLVRKVVLLGIPYYDEQGRAIEYAENVVDKPVKEDLYHLQESWEFAVTNRNEKVTLDRAYDNFVDVIQAKQYRTWAYHAVFTYPAENRAPLVTQPVLILNTHGSLENETREIGPLFPNARLVEIPELHHGIFDAGPELLAGHARPFLDNP